MKKEEKLVSIIMNCFNGEDYLFDALKSVHSQSYYNFELIFYDNCSTDNSKKIFESFKDYRFKYFKSKKKEMLGLARLNALKKTKGIFFLFFDCDDYMLPNKLAVQIKLFKNKHIGAVYSNSFFFSKYRKKKLYKIHPRDNAGNIFYDLIENYYISLDTVIFKKKIVEKLPESLDSNFNLIHDLDLIIRLSKVYQIKYCPEVLSYWRAHRTSTSNNSYLRFAKEKKIFEKKIINLYPKDEKLVKALSQFREKYYIEECIGYLLQNNNSKLLNLLKKIKSKKIKFLLFVFSRIPFSNYLVNWIVYINKLILLR